MLLCQHFLSIISEFNKKGRKSEKERNGVKIKREESKELRKCSLNIASLSLLIFEIISNSLVTEESISDSKNTMMMIREKSLDEEVWVMGVLTFLGRQ